MEEMNKFNSQTQDENQSEPQGFQEETFEKAETDAVAQNTATSFENLGDVSLDDEFDDYERMVAEELQANKKRDEELQAKTLAETLEGTMAKKNEDYEATGAIVASEPENATGGQAESAIGGQAESADNRATEDTASEKAETASEAGASAIASVGEEDTSNESGTQELGEGEQVGKSLDEKLYESLSEMNISHHKQRLVEEAGTHIKVGGSASGEYFPDKPIGVYVKYDEDGNVREVNSDIFIKDLTGWTKIDEGYGDRFAHAQSQYFEQE